MLRWYPSPLLRVVLELTFLPVAFFSVFALIVVGRPDTPWEITSTFRGPGWNADFAVLLGVLAAGWALVALGWRGAHRTFRVSIVLWHAAWTSVVSAHAVAADDIVLRGEAAGFRLAVGALAPVCFGTALLGAAIWALGDMQRGSAKRSVSPLRRRNRVAGGLGVVAAGLACAAFAGDLDQVGVLSAIAAMAAFHEAIRPVNPSAELHRAFLAEGSATE